MNLEAMSEEITANASTGAAIKVDATVAELNGWSRSMDWPISGDQLACRLAGVR